MQPTPRSLRALCLIAGLLGSSWICVPSARGGVDLALGLERLSFHDEQARDQYGNPLGITITGRILRLNWLDLTGQLSFARKQVSADHVAFIESAQTSLEFVPLRLRPRFRYRLTPRWSLWGGPQVAWAWFREGWQVAVPRAGLAVDRKKSGSWFGFGGTAGIRCGLGSAGAVLVSFEAVWCGATRAAVPGNANQDGDMTGGWSALTLMWQPPLGRVDPPGRAGRTR